jgi:hypothetical protein
VKALRRPRGSVSGGHGSHHDTSSGGELDTPQVFVSPRAR